MGFNTTNDTLAHQENYGQSYYIGTVTANNDTVGIGRVQAHVEGLFDTDQGEVPYVGPMKDSPFGFGAGAKGPYGVYGMPQVGSTIKIELQNGDEHQGLYSTLITAQSAHPWFNTPSRWGFVDPAGNSLQIDMSTGAWTWTHQSGDSIAYDGSGNVVEVIKGNETQQITGNESRTIGGSETDSITGSSTKTVGGGITFNVTGNAQINCTTFDLNASGAATYKATSHTFNGPIIGSSTIAAAGDITDLTGTGNAQTMGDMRAVYNEHDHLYDDNGHQNTTEPPLPQIP
jgi:hypothetical protein